MMSHQQRPFHMVVGGGQYNDTTFTKIFVGGLAWETQRDTMRHYFQQFGDILEAVVITDKNTGRSKGYGFVTFKDPEAAIKACQNPSPVVDGRRANCNLASFGAQKTRPPHPPPQHGPGRFKPAPGLVAPPAYHSSSSTYQQQPIGQYTFPYSVYGYSGYSQETMYPMNYYNVYGGQQFSPYYATGVSGAPGMFQNYYPFYAPQTSQQSHNIGIQYPQIVQYPYLPQQFNSAGILSLPSSSLPMTTSSTGAMTSSTTAAVTGPMVITTTAAAVSGVGTGSSQGSGTASEQVSPTT